MVEAVPILIDQVRTMVNEAGDLSQGGRVRHESDFPQMKRAFVRFVFPTIVRITPLESVGFHDSALLAPNARNTRNGRL